MYRDAAYTMHSVVVKCFVETFMEAFINYVFRSELFEVVYIFIDQQFNLNCL